MRITKFLPFRAQPVVADACSVARLASPTYQLTIVSVDTTLNAIRKQLYFELKAVDLRVSQVRISRWDSEQLVSTIVIVDCPPTMRVVLNAIALRLGQSPDVRRVQWESDAGTALAVLPRQTAAVDRRLS